MGKWTKEDYERDWLHGEQSYNLKLCLGWDDDDYDQ